MHRVLLGIVAAAVAAWPASAQSFAAGDFSASAGVNRFAQPSDTHVRIHRGFPMDHRRHGGRGDGSFYGGMGYAGAYYYGDYDANRSFDPDRWNDWWHERPERAFPRWVWRNQNCTEDRMWWSGGGWRCTP